MIDKNIRPYIKDIGNGILYILINTENKWEDYQLFKTIPDEGYFSIAFYNDDNNYVEETFKVFDGFKRFDYIITDSQNKDQITVVCLPVNLVYPELKKSGEN